MRCCFGPMGNFFAVKNSFSSDFILNSVCLLDSRAHFSPKLAHYYAEPLEILVISICEVFVRMGGRRIPLRVSKQ